MESKRFKRSFFRRDVVSVAPDLLGAYLHRRLADGTELIGKIVETEAYAMYEPASHSSKGKTPRTAVMFGDAGFAYVYFTYGMYWCMNVVANETGHGEAVLIRAIQPITGVEEMRKRRSRIKREVDIANGPGKLCLAMEIGKAENGLDLIDGDVLWFTRGESGKQTQVATSSRVGISVAKELPWRFYIKGNAYVSPAKPSDPNV